MKKELTQDEIDALAKWLIKMAKFWSISGLAYVTIFYQSTLAAWILGSLVGMFVWEKHKEKQGNEDNGRKTAE
jgi:hypothetical protein